MAQVKETKEDLHREIAALRDQIAAADRAGVKLARYFQWDREEYQSNPSLIGAIRADPVARRWLAAIKRKQR